MRKLEKLKQEARENGFKPFDNETEKPGLTMLLVGPLPPPYHGVAVMTERLLEGLKKRNQFKIYHLNTQDPRGVGNMGHLDAWNVYCGTVHVAKFAWLLLKSGAQLVYLPISQNFWGYLRDSGFLIISRLFRRNVVVHFHSGTFDTFYQESCYPMRLFIKKTLANCKAGIVVGYRLKKMLNGILPDEKTFAVYNGIDGKPYQLAPHIRDSRDRNGHFNVLYVGTLMESKGVMELLETARMVLEITKDVQFTFAGAWKSPQEKAKAELIIRENNLSPHVRFLGNVIGEEKVDTFGKADVFTFPTFYHYESQGLVNLEAMASSLPVISTPRATIPELVLDGENGFLIPEHRPDLVAQKILDLKNSPSLRRRMGNRGRELFEQKFTAENFIEGVEKVLQSLHPQEPHKRYS
jgi:glycosyltransferase involved in cell wall biosynthesis